MIHTFLKYASLCIVYTGVEFLLFSINCLLLKVRPTLTQPVLPHEVDTFGNWFQQSEQNKTLDPKV